MKKHLSLTLIALLVLLAACPIFGQREGGGGRSGEGRRRGQDLTEEQRTRMREMRERWQNMSEEEREKARAEMRQRFGGRGRRLGREDQLKAIEDVEKQLAKLKKGIQAQPTERRSFRDMSEEERNKMREQFTKAREERNKAFKAIITRIARLQGQRGPAEGEELLIINTAQLKSIQELAVKEKAKETAQRLERLARPRGFFSFSRRRQTGERPPASSTTEGTRRRSTQ
jgi:Spy/CpxP family protein refolding chaperone